MLDAPDSRSQRRFARDDGSAAGDLDREGWDAIVVGSGLGGLTTAAYLITNGLRTLVLEQYNVAGGSSHVFRRKRAWEFDVGMHYLGDCTPKGLLPTILRGVGLEGKVEFLPMDPDGFDTLLFPDLTFRVPRGWDNYLERLINAFPEEESGLRKCVKVLRKLAKELVEAGVPHSVLGAVRFALKAPTVVRWGTRSLEDLFDSCELSEQARAVLAAESGTYGAPPSRASLMLHAVLIDHYVKDGAFYPKGGSQVFAAHLVDVIRSHGGDVRTRARVERIEVEDGRVVGVELRGGEKLSAPTVVSNADIKKTFLDLVGEEHLSPKTVKIMRRSRMALPLFCVYLGLDIDLRERIPNTNFFVNPDYDVEGAYAECYAGRVPENLPLYVTSASVKDSEGTSAPEGCSSIEMVAVAPSNHSFWHVNEGPAAGERYSRNPNYLAVKERFTEKLIDGAAQVIPDIREHILWKEASTPITHERFTLASGGTSYGMEHSPDQSGMRRPRAKTEIGGLYLAGASTVYAHGIAGVMFGGLACAGAVLRRDLQAQVFGGRVFGDPDKLTSGGPDWDPLEVCRHLSKRRDRGRRRAPVGVSGSDGRVSSGSGLGAYVGSSRPSHSP